NRAGLGVEVALADLRPVLHLLDRDVARLPTGFLVALRRLVSPLAVIKDLADRRVGLRSHLDQIEIEVTGDVERLGQRLDAELLTVRVDEADFTGPDAIVDPRLVVGWRRR